MHEELTAYAIAFRRPVATAAGTWTVRRGAWLRLEDDDGREGIGEAAPLQALDSAEALFAAIAQGPVREAARELAILDLEGQRSGQSLTELLGGTAPSRLPVNALLFATDAEAAAQEAGAAVERGFRTLKLKVGAASPEEDVRRIVAVRSRIGPQVALRLDANAAWDEDTAQRVLAAVHGCNIEYVEDPVAGDLAGVRAHAGIAVAADVRTLEEGWRRVRERSVDVLVLKPMALGGLRAVRALAIAAREAGLGVVITSVFDTAVGVAAAAHLAASLPGPAPAHGLATVPLLEEAPVQGLEPPHGGELAVPAGPGLGVRLRERTP